MRDEQYRMNSFQNYGTHHYYSEACTNYAFAILPWSLIDKFAQVGGNGCVLDGMPIHPNTRLNSWKVRNDV